VFAPEVKPLYDRASARVPLPCVLVHHADDGRAVALHDDRELRVVGERRVLRRVARIVRV